MLSLPLFYRRAAWAFGILIVITVIATAAAPAYLSEWSASRVKEGALVPAESILVWERQSVGRSENSSRAEARFILYNRGGRPVKVTGVESGCGCAKPEVRPERIKPGDSAIVDVHALAQPFGIKDVPIVIRTDSASTPEIMLTLRVIGSQKPPFLYLFDGDLNFRGSFDPYSSREVTLTSIEPSGERDKTVEIVSTLDAVTIELVDVRDQPYGYGEPETVRRFRTYRIGFDYEPAGTFLGSIIAIDPWMPGRTMELPISGRFQSGLRATPPLLALDGAEKSRGEIVLISDEPIGALDYEVEVTPDAGLSIDVSEPTRSSTGRVRRVAVALGGTEAGLTEGSARLTIYDPSSENRVVVPIRITPGSTRP